MSNTYQRNNQAASNNNAKPEYYNDVAGGQSYVNKVDLVEGKHGDFIVLHLGIKQGEKVDNKPASTLYVRVTPETEVTQYWADEFLKAVESSKQKPVITANVRYYKQSLEYYETNGELVQYIQAKLIEINNIYVDGQRWDDAEEDKQIEQQAAEHAVRSSGGSQRSTRQSNNSFRNHSNTRNNARPQQARNSRGKSQSYRASA